MTVFEALSVMFLFGMFILALLTYIHTSKKSRTAPGQGKRSSRVEIDLFIRSSPYP
ncbi:putative holin-like toxin [Paenibacillus alvei]|uniref:putative holin-like toxin n=1 Tax=Paenibacillus alvei TaxID=44250 RepID=UPI0014322DAB|nr:putative holin-like toxin [Paenibacillus alvei]